MSAERQVAPRCQDQLINVSEMFRAIADLSKLHLSIQELIEELRAVKVDVQSQNQSCRPSGWMDAKAAAKYLSMSPGTFEKYRARSFPSIKGYRVGGKFLYKQEDLDNFVKLWEQNSGEPC
jgi:hypothetical protein